MLVSYLSLDSSHRSLGKCSQGGKEQCLHLKTIKVSVVSFRKVCLSEIFDLLR